MKMLYDKITEDMKTSMKNHDKETLSTIRMLFSMVTETRQLISLFCYENYYVAKKI